MARRRGRLDPLNHCALNVALYGRAGKRWTLTERGRGALRQGSDHLVIGPSAVSWDGNGLRVGIDEVTAPLPSRVRGEVRLYPSAQVDYRVALDPLGRHWWRPLAPSARVEVKLERPDLRWSGHGYLDMNRGDEPIEQGFRRWDWSRAGLADGGAAVLYDVTRRGGDRLSLAIRFDATGGVDAFAPPPSVALPPTLWRVARGTQADPGHGAQVLQTLEDTPFYARSMLASRLLGESVTSMHESLCLDRFRSGWVQAMLPFRMPRMPS